MKVKKSELILTTFDGSMKGLRILPQCKETRVEYEISYYDNNDNLIGAILNFDRVIAIDFQVNYFDNCIGSELGGLYEILEISYKTELIEKIFKNRRNGYLYNGDYDYDVEDEHDSLNYKEGINNILKVIDSYHLYQQQTDGGIFLILAKGYTLSHK